MGMRDNARKPAERLPDRAVGYRHEPASRQSSPESEIPAAAKVRAWMFIANSNASVKVCHLHLFNKRDPHP
jgi:hypothetical protein